jgi:hydroxyacylglutathione hydrolase
MFFEQIFEEKLAQYAYLIGCQKNGEAIIIDPMRDIKRYKDLAAKHGLKIVAAAETHIHADYLTGIREFAEKGISVYVSDEGNKDWKYEYITNSKYQYTLLKDGDQFKIGNIKFSIIHSPGHTPEHISFLVTDEATTNQPMGILSGDFVFVGDVGRPDLLETAAGQVGAMEDSAKTMYLSIKRFQDLPAYLQLWPGHGAGSACGKALGAVPKSTVGYEQQFNKSIASAITEQKFVDFILEGQPEPPFYFARMKRQNKLGPKVLGEIPKPKKMNISDLLEKMAHKNTVVIDTRNRIDFMNSHLKGSILATMNKTFNTIAGSYVSDEQDIYLIVDDSQINEAVVDLIRIGLDNIRGYVTPIELLNAKDELLSTDIINFERVDKMMESEHYTLLDVRKKTEYDEGHGAGALNISHTRLLDRISEVPLEKPVIVHCKSGARASAAASLLERFGHTVHYVNDVVEPWLEKNDQLENV